MSQMMQTSSACLVMLFVAQATVVAADSTKQLEELQEVEPKQLSGPLSDQMTEYPASRPDWMDARSELTELPHTWVVVSGPYDTRQASEEELRFMVHASIETYLRGLPGADGRFDYFPLTDEWIEENLVTRRYSGELIQGGLTMYEDAVELRIDDNTRREFVAALKNIEVRDRLAALGMLVFTGLVTLMCSSAFFGMLSSRVERRDTVKMSTC